MTSLLARLAASSTPPVFIVSGRGGQEASARLQASGQVRPVDSPAAATLLVIVGDVPPVLDDALLRTHDGRPHPRATIYLATDPSQHTMRAVPHAAVAGSVAEALRLTNDLVRALLSGRRASDPPLLPDVDANPWRGVGPYGQGGSGMTGGTPYGRPMAELAGDRDGLRLDVLPVEVGPLFPRLATGVTVSATIAGDVVTEAKLADSPFAGTQGPEPSTIFERALSSPVSIAELETARARDHLRWIASSLAAMGLPALALRTLTLATARSVDVGLVAALGRRLSGFRIPSVVWAGRGVIAAEEVRGSALGPVSRASHDPEDARSDEAAYRALGFQPLVRTGGDAADRWTLRLCEAISSLQLAERAGTATAWGSGVVESPRGRLTSADAPYARAQPLIPALLHGCEWGEALISLVSLDLDPSEVAPSPMHRAAS